MIQSFDSSPHPPISLFASRHAGKDGQEVDIGPPRTLASRRSAANADGELGLVQSILFYEFLEARAAQGDVDFDDEDFYELFELLEDLD